MINVTVKIFFIALFINLLYELLHSLLYKTCLEAPVPKYIYLILKAAVFDAIFITLIYYITYVIFKKENLFYHYSQLAVFSLFGLMLAYGLEWYSVKNNRWEYSGNMPLVLGMGITPIVQLALTGIVSVYLAFNFC